ncbi:MAG: VTT domain-containing protein [Polyangiales bacterium]
MLDEFLHTLEHGPEYWAYALVVGAAAVEYVFPPVPGDAVALFAVALAVRAQLNWVLVYVAMTMGALMGGLAAWRFGIWLADHEGSWPSFLKTPGSKRALDAVRRGYARHGGLYLGGNRFLPVLRAFFFVGAGLSGMRAAPVVIFGGISAALWNALLLGAGYAVGSNWDALRDLAQRYAAATLVLVVVTAVAVVGRLLWDSKRP